MDTVYTYFIIAQLILIHLLGCHIASSRIKSEKLSPLGTWLRSPEHTPLPERIHDNNMNNPALIHIWKYGSALERRHIQRFHKTHRFSPWDRCSVNDCELSYDINDMERADAVIFHLHWMTRDDAKKISLWSQQKRHPNQLWIFLIDESPMHTNIWPEYNGLFNWSMTYRTDSDIPVAYGRTIRRQKHKNNIFNSFSSIMKQKTKLVAIMGRNCASSERSGSNRWEYVEELHDYLPGQLDIYGQCLNGNATACPGHFSTDCPLLNRYKFYLAFENSNCQEYITEKVFWNAYSKFSVPVIMGSPRDDCNRLLPPHSYIHVDNFPSFRDLADYLLMLDLYDDAYYEYHVWRDDYIVLNEHGYFGAASRHYCRVCEALRYNPTQSPKTYWNLERYWNKHDQCSINTMNVVLS